MRNRIRRPRRYSRSLRRLPVLALVGAATTIGSLVLASPSLAQEGCQVSGQATYTPNGPGANQSFGWTMQADLTNCEPSSSGATPQSISVGQTFSESVPITTSTGTVQGTAEYQQPIGVGEGFLSSQPNSCPANDVGSNPIITWSDGTITTAILSGGSAGDAVLLQGQTNSESQLSLVSGTENPAGTAPSTYDLSTTNTTLPAGTALRSALAFTTEDPQSCTTAQGLSQVDVNGTLELG